MLERLEERGELDTHAQPEVFYIDPKKGLAGLRKVLELPDTPRIIEGVDIAHLGGGETVASLVQFIDGLPFKPGYRRFRIADVDGIDDFRSIYEVVSRRFRRLTDDERNVSRHPVDRRRQGTTECGDGCLSGPANRAADGDFSGQTRRRDLSPGRIRVAEIELGRGPSP